MSNEELIKEFREKWGRFYISDSVGIDWVKPKKCLHKSGVFCIASNDIENDILKALQSQRSDLLKKIEGKMEVLRELLKDFKEGRINCKDNDEYISLVGQTKGKLQALEDIKKLIDEP